jgi:uncharacterized small protein (DUF1192 family)
MKSNRLKTMLQISIILLCIIGLSRPAIAADPEDVPPNHWSYKAVKLLVDKGYLQLYQDQTFQGDKPVDRYTLATIVAKILDEVASGQASINKDDMNLIAKVTNEYRSELIEAVRKVALFNKRADDLNKQDLIIKEDITKTQDEQNELQRQAQWILADLLEVKDRVAKLEDENAKLKAELEKVRADADQRKYFIYAALILGVWGIMK